MRKDLFELVPLKCPFCGASLAMLKVHAMRGDEIEEALLQCKSLRCRRVYPVISSIPVLIADLSAYIPTQAGLLRRLEGGCLGDAFTADLERFCGVAASSFRRPSAEEEKAHRMSLAYYLLRQYPMQVTPADGLEGLIPIRRDSALYGIDGIIGKMPRTGGVAVDFGCAAGRFVFELASAADFSLGIDYSFDLVESALRIQRESQLMFVLSGEKGELRPATIKFEAGDAGLRSGFIAADVLAPVLPEGSLSIASALNIITELPKPVKTLVSIDRALGSGGYLLFGSTYNWMAKLDDEMLQSLMRSHESYEELFRAVLTGAVSPALLSGAYSIIDERDITFYAYIEKRRYMLYVMDFLLCRKMERQL
jgi:uncharacterized protein YbaR (Trm112 family)/SAM-dependent methyltransferase